MTELDHAHVASAPHAILVTGSPATGKSTLAAALARRLSAVLIDQDVATGALVNVISALIGVHDLDDPRLAEVTRTARYETIIALAEANLRCDLPVILVAPFTEERRSLAAWNKLEARLVAAGAVPTMVWLELEPGEMIARMRARAAHRDRDKLSDESALLARVALDPPAGPHVRLDAAASVPELVEAVQTRLH